MVNLLDKKEIAGWSKIVARAERIRVELSRLKACLEADMLPR
jgi:hypothetical protein